MNSNAYARPRPRAPFAEIAFPGLLVLLVLGLSPGCARNGSRSSANGAPATTGTTSMSASTSVGSDGPTNAGSSLPARQDGDAAKGREGFRFETFGNEGFWTDAVRLPAGVMATKVTPFQALKLGLEIDADALDAATRQALADQLKTDPTGQSSALLNDPMTTAKLFNANAVIGMPVKDSNGDGVLDATKGDKVGAACALCHTVTDGSVFRMANGGSIGRRRDGLANHNLDMGAIFATATNSRALSCSSR